MELTVGKFLRFVVALFFIFVAGWLIYTLSSIITIIIISMLSAYILDPLASYLEAKGSSRTLATFLIFVSIFSVLTIIGILIIPALVNELQTLQRNINVGALDNLEKFIEINILSNFSFIDTSGFNLHDKLTSIFNEFSSQLLNFAANIVSFVYALIIIPFLTFFLLKDGRRIKKAFISYVPNKYFEMVLNVWHKIDLELGGYLRGQFIEALVVGILAIIALIILNIKYALVIGIFAGLANFIPYVGPLAGAISAILVAVANGHDATMLTYIAGAFLIIQLNDNVIMQPMVLSKSVNLHPLVIILAVLVGGQFFGILGMFLAVPAAGIIKVTSKEFYNGIRKFRLI